MANNRIVANHVHHVATRMCDTAGIYTLSVQPGTVVSENSVHAIQMSPYVFNPEHWFYLYLDEGSSFITVRDNWCPEEKFLKNANGPGNIWENNGPNVSKKVNDAAGLEPAFGDLLKKSTGANRENGGNIQFIGANCSNDIRICVQIVLENGWLKIVTNFHRILSLFQNNFIIQKTSYLITEGLLYKIFFRRTFLEDLISSVRPQILLFLKNYTVSRTWINVLDEGVEYVYV